MDCCCTIGSVVMLREAGVGSSCVMGGRACVVPACEMHMPSVMLTSHSA